MDNTELRQELMQGAKTLGIALTEEAASKLVVYQDELLRWNRKINLTAITDPVEALEKHLLDSLAVAPEIGAGVRLLDVGSGAGLPGIPLKILEPSLHVTLVDAVQKKVGFLKAVAAGLQLRGVTALHARLEGTPSSEGLEPVDVAISRAFADLDDWLKLAAPYVVSGGRVVAMLGKAPRDPQAAGAAAGLSFVSLRHYQLPFSHAERHVAVYRR